MEVQEPATMQAGFGDAMKEETRTQLFELNKMTEMTAQIFSNLVRLQEEYTYCYNLCSQIPGNLSDFSNNQLPMEQRKELQRKLDLIKTLGNLRQRLARMRTEFTKKLKSTLSDIDAVLPKVLNDARKTFERRQQLHRNGAPFDARMVDALQEWYVALENIIVKIRGQIINQNELRKSLPFPGETDNDFPAMLANANNALVSLVERAFMIENQPNQVMKKDCKFKVSVRLLCCGMLNLQGNPPIVKAFILSEKQAADVKHGRDIHAEECGKILNGEAPMSFQSGKLAIDFANMCLKGFERPAAQRKQAEPVTEGKFCLHFTSKVTLRLNALEQQIVIQVMSLPIVITVHGNQECDANSTAIWDNQFADIERTPFNVRESVPWSEMATLLSLLFYGWTGKGLDSTSLMYLKTILFENEPNNFEVSWKKFKKDNIPGRKFTFWEWFWSIGKLVREVQVKEIWKRGLIIGFIDQNEAYSRLMTLPSGTFLFRFSNSTLGGISAAFVKDNPDVAGGKAFKSLRPFTVKDFETIKLADCVRYIDDLRTLYPNQDKAEAFGEFYTSVGDSPGDGYLDVDLRLHIREKLSGLHSSNDAGSPMSDSCVLSPLASNFYGQSCVSPEESVPSSTTQELCQSQFPSEALGFQSDNLSSLIMPQTLDEILAKLHEDFTTRNNNAEFPLHEFDAYAVEKMSP